jgi:hypothetical protein
MGSCFAQHISRHLGGVGGTYFVAEQPASSLTAREAAARNYGVFSARYGNVYTVRQAVQLFDRAFGAFEPIDHAWHLDDRVVDAFRPQIEPDGFGSVDEMVAARVDHLVAVREVFTRSEVLVFTLGLTETWESTLDGAVYPVAPGVHGGDFSDERYRFVNIPVARVIEDLSSFVERVRSCNPAVRILLTVSPVPLVATAEPRHVLVSNTISKATLRVAAADVTDRYDFVDYFPSYEIIAGSAAGARYFEPDLRQVSSLGVAHVMRIFERHMMEGSPVAPVRREVVEADENDVVCDEDLIEAALVAGGLSTPGT